ncbi:hypothetical protein BA895_01895 [Humibacillus sp. DSM 29435]|uniref:nuclear transport factor 2 family protein n=1 Tax=Humibacillus sp. DSM 29435 TaxID=1869167 RepID=UPI0008731939|nr:nuclear transport factor 2 family protein [Humibacillus sp. DSM 29435]OFE18930.1 hypothetical protein BA895_01895 [Humibacillus sp. DSM 29435]
MEACHLLTSLCEAIDDHRWGDLPMLLHDDFTCRYAHTGETFDKDAWVRLNVEYPGFEHLVVHDLVCSDRRAVARCAVTARVDGHLERFEVATFVASEDGLIKDMTEVWTDVARTPPVGTRPGQAGGAPIG